MYAGFRHQQNNINQRCSYIVYCTIRSTQGLGNGWQWDHSSLQHFPNITGVSGRLFYAIAFNPAARQQIQVPDTSIYGHWLVPIAIWHWTIFPLITIVGHHAYPGAESIFGAFCKSRSPFQCGAAWLTLIHVYHSASGFPMYPLLGSVGDQSSQVVLLQKRIVSSRPKQKRLVLVNVGNTTTTFAFSWDTRDHKPLYECC